MQNTWLENRIHKWHNEHLEGGGEVSDLTTATMIINNEVNSPMQLYGARINEQSPVLGSPATSGVISVAPATSSIQIEVILYKGAAFIVAAPNVHTTGFLSTLQLSGSVEYNSTLDALIITGDCTITAVR